MTWSDGGRGDFKACKLHSVLGKDKFGRVQDDAMAPTGIQPVHRLEEAVGNGVGPHQGVVNTFGLLREVHDEFIEASAVGVP